MYTIQEAVCTSRSAMNHIETPRERESVAGPFYQHPYGGVARDIFVSREGFARFFQRTPESVDRLRKNCKTLDYAEDLGHPYEWVEILGMVGQEIPGGPCTYKITFIDFRHGALMDHAVRSTV